MASKMLHLSTFVGGRNVGGVERHLGITTYNPKPLKSRSIPIFYDQ